MMATFTLRAVGSDRLERKQFEAVNAMRAVRSVRTNLAQYVRNCEPWYSGKIVLLDETGVIICRVDNLEMRQACDCGDCDECYERQAE